MTDLPATRIETLTWWDQALRDPRVASPQEQRRIKAELGRTDLFFLLVVLCKRIDLNRDWLFDRVRMVQAEPNGCLDLWAREHGKSSIITFGLTIQDILRDPEVTVGIFSHSRGIAKAFLRQIMRELEVNTALHACYPEILWREPKREAPKWSEDEGLVVKRKGNPKESTVEAWGLVDGQPTGRHFKVRVYDDVVTRESVTTPEQVEKTTKAWELSDNLGTEDGAARHIGTRYSLHDSYSTMVARGAVKARIFAATHNGKMDGRPILFSEEEWQRRLRTQSKSTIAAQLLQNPLADEAAMFSSLWFRSYEVRPRTLNVYITADPSRGRSADSDNTAISVIGISKAGSKFLLDGYRHRMTLSQRWVALRELHKRWSRAPGVQHLAVGYERYGAQSDDEYFQEQMEREKYWFTIEELNWTRDGRESKRERVERLEPDLRNSRFFMPLPVWRDGKPSTWHVDLDPQSKTFGDVIYRDAGRPTKAQLAAIEGGTPELIAKAIKRVDQDGRVYDVTLAMIEELGYFPFGEYKDLVDAASRVYDMQGRGPAVIIKGPGKTPTEPALFWDS